MDALRQDKVEYIIAMAREVAESSPAIIDEELAEESEPNHFSELSLAAQAEESTIEDFASDTTYQELKSVINGMHEDERSELVALMWVGRGTYSKSEWNNAVADAREASNDHTAEYMMRTTLMPDYLDEGLSIMSDD
ncbi:DUF3775 domain-containing protein [Paremcibacter congregatus]|uniref:DUF3775 domain-containing protein n=1 Tax=Paremcibacter congregatus TaxID=2043170 RepID=UPI0030ED3EA8|tara:strand:+ start:2514 stop:2924 length:411 start_codon:yes stop_codon:yes gene_type:complete